MVSNASAFSAGVRWSTSIRGHGSRPLQSANFVWEVTEFNIWPPRARAPRQKVFRIVPSLAEGAAKHRPPCPGVYFHPSWELVKVAISQGTCYENRHLAILTEETAKHGPPCLGVHFPTPHPLPLPPPRSSHGFFPTIFMEKEYVYR